MPADVGVRWRAPFDGGRPITMYEIDGGEGNTRVTKQSVSGSTLETTFLGVPDGLHFFRVRARNSIGWGEWSDGIMVSVNISNLVATADQFAGSVSIFSIAGATGSRPVPIKHVLIPSGRSALDGIAYLGDNKVAVLDDASEVVSIFSIAGASDERATEIKNIPVPAGRTDGGGITYLGNDRVAICDDQDDVVSIFSIAGASGASVTEIKNITIPEDKEFPSGITYLGNNVVAVACKLKAPPELRHISIFSIDVESGETASEIKSFRPPRRASSIGGITYIGGNQIAILDFNTDTLSIVSLETASGALATAVKQLNMPTTHQTGFGVTFLSNIHGF